MLTGNVPGVGRVRLKEEATIQLRTLDGRTVTRLLSDPSKEPFEQGRGGEWRLHDGRTVRRSISGSGRLVTITPIWPSGGWLFDEGLTYREALEMEARLE